MHATNVLVRHGDAIIIDFEKMNDHYPLTYDPASLEGGLLVEGFAKNLKNESINSDELVELLKPLYKLDVLISRDEILCHRGSSAEWYYDCVNQIRTRNWSAEHIRGQYALTLALCLIRKGCNRSQRYRTESPLLKFGY